MKEKKLKVFALPIEEFEKKYPVSYSIVVPGIPEGHVAKFVSVRPCQTFIILKDKTIEQYNENSLLPMLAKQHQQQGFFVLLLVLVQFIAHTILNVLVDDEVELFFC